MSRRLRQQPHRPAVMAMFPKHAVAIAELISAWNTLEDSCTLFLPVFTYIDMDQADLMLAQMVSSQSRLDVVLAAGRFELAKTPEDLAELEALFDQLRKRLTVRNQYAHGIYVINDKNELCIMRRRYETGHARNRQVVHLAGLKQEVTLALRLVSRLVNFLVKVEARIPEDMRQALRQIRALRFPPHPTNQE